VLVVLACSAAAAAGPDLDAPINATWTGVGLRSWAAIVGAGTVPIVVDRRLDPDAPISLDCRNEPLRDVVRRAAAQVGGEPVVLSSTLRIVPRGAADLLLRAETGRDAALAKLPATQRAVLGRRRGWNWPDAAVPAELVATAAADVGISIEGVDALPHDHLPAASLPPLTLAERLDLVLAQYDRRMEWRPGPRGSPAGRIIPLDADLPPRPAAAAEPRPATDRRPASGKPAGRPSPDDTFSLQVAAPLDQVLGVIATRLGLTLQLDEESLRRRGIAPGEIVRATVKDASRGQLLDAILAPLQIEWKIEGDTLRVFAMPQ
jgi:hypothetical protein